MSQVFHGSITTLPDEIATLTNIDILYLPTRLRPRYLGNPARLETRQTKTVPNSTTRHCELRREFLR